MPEDAEGLLCGMRWVLESFPTHADWRLYKVMHLVLLAKVPGMTLVPHADDHFTAIEEACLAKLGYWIGFMPDEKLERIEHRVKDLVPLTNQVVATERKDSACRLEDAHELITPRGWFEARLVPVCQVIVDFLAPGELHVASRVRAEVIGRVG